ncbi:MAG: MCE family protein [Phycisphaerae bacterium]|nr:MCE family protein [Phycisphaerae bacterium]
MTERGRNMAVGFFVLIGFVLLCLLIFKFSEVATFATGGYRLTTAVPNSSGISPGKTVHYLGIEIGDVTAVNLSPGGDHVEVVMRIDQDVDIPANAVLQSAVGGFGTTLLDIRLPASAAGGVDPPTGALPKDGSATIRSVTGEGGLIPRSVTSKVERLVDKLEAVDQLVANLTEMTRKRRLADVREGRAEPNLSSTIEHFDEMIGKVADDENAAHLKQTLKQLSDRTAQLEQTLTRANETLARASGAFDKVSGAVDKASQDIDQVKEQTLRLVGKLHDDAASLADLLRTMNTLAKGVQEGQGTVGKLLTSDELHRNLNLLVLQLNQTSQDISRLVQKIEARGILGKDP